MNIQRREKQHGLGNSSPPPYWCMQPANNWRISKVQFKPGSVQRGRPSGPVHGVLRAPPRSSPEGVGRFTVYYSRIPKQFQARLNIWNIQNKVYYPFSSCLHLSRGSKHRQHTQIHPNNPDRCINTCLSSPGVKI